MEEQNLDELLKKSTIADQNFIYNSIAKQLVTNENQELVVRKTGKISLDGSEEEIKETLAKILGTTPDKIDFNDIQKQIDKIKNEYLATKDIINEYDSFLKKSNASKDKFEELDDIGKFIKKYDPSLILKIPENVNQVPDFILKGGNKTIGIEHTRLIDQPTQKIIGTLEKIIRNTRKHLLQNNITSNDLINIGFNFKEDIINKKKLTDKITQNEIKKISTNIANIIIEYKKDKSTVLPNFIDKILTQETRFETEINIIENYISKDDYNSLLKNLIEIKESKIDSYTDKKNLNEIWLLIINSGIKSASGFTLNNPEKIKSKFDRVIVMDNFDYDIKVIS